MVAARALVHSQVSSALAESAVRMKRQADGRRRETSLLVNDKAWLATQNLPLRLGTRKLAAKWTGPFRLVEQVG